MKEQVVSLPIKLFHKKNNAATDGANTKKFTYGRNYTMKKAITQTLKNLPVEILALPRFLKTRKDNPKAPTLRDWQKPEKQKLYSELDGILGFVAATENDESLIFFDFDHVLDDNGNFVNETAEKWFRFIHAEKYFCEQSQSGKGLHMFGLPTKGKFTKGRRELNLGDGAKIEIFYGTTKFCLVTGNLFHCSANAPIAHGQFADDIFQAVLNEITKQNSNTRKFNRQETEPTLIYQSNDSNEYDSFRAPKMLDAINPTILSYDDWLAVFTSCKTIGLHYSIVDAFNRLDTDRYNESENLAKWQEPVNPSFDIKTLHGIAKRFGYEEKTAYHEWCSLHPEFKSKIIHKPVSANEDSEEKFVWTQDMIKSCPVNLRLPNNYLFNHKGITLVVPPKKDGDNPKYVCAARTPIIPTKIFREPKQNTFTYEIATLIRGVWRTTEIAGRALADPRAIITLADSGALIDEPKLICRFLNAVISLNPDLNETKAYDQPGWHDGKYIYPTGGKDYVVRRPGFNYAEEFATRGNAVTLKNAFLEACQRGGAVACLYFGTALLSALVQPLNILNAQIQLNSKSGGGKTALAKLAAALFGNPRELIRTFGATEKNRQAVAAAYNDLPNFFDEMETMNGKRAEEQLSQMIYSYAEGKGNQAQKRDGTARQAFRFYGSRLMTAERPILKEHDLRGAYKRLVQIRCPKLFDDQFAADLHFIAENNFGHFGKPWTEFIPAHLKEIREILGGFGKIFAQNPQNIEPTQLKTVTSAFVALQYFLICIGAQDAFDDVAAARDIKEIIALLPTNTEIDDTVRAIESLTSFVAGHTKSFNRPIKDSTTGKIEEVSAWGNECYGRIFENSEVSFLPHAIKKILEDELKFASADKLIAEWKEQGNILITDKDRTTHKVAIGDTRTRTIHFKEKILLAPLEDEELLYYEESGAI